MKFGINSYSYAVSHTAVGFLQRWQERGFEYFELMAVPGHLWPSTTSRDEIRQTRRFVEENAISIATLNQPNMDINITGMTPEMREYSIRTISAIIDLAPEIGCRQVIIGPGKANPLLPSTLSALTSHFFKALDALVPRCDKNGVTLLVENMPFSILPEADGIMRALDTYGHDDIGVCYDVANGAFIGQDVARELKAVAPRLKVVHLCDTGSEKYEHVAYPHPGSIVPFEDVMRHLKKVPTVTPPILEVISSDPDREISQMVTALEALSLPR